MDDAERDLAGVVAALEKRIQHLEQFAIGKCERCHRFTSSMDMWSCTPGDQGCRSVKNGDVA